MFNSIRQYLSQNYSSSNNSDHYYGDRNDNWLQHKDRHVGNWLADIVKPHQQAYHPQHYEKEHFFWNRKGKKNKYKLQEQQQRRYFEDPTALAPGLAHRASHSSLFRQSSNHHSRDSLFDPHHQLDSNTTQHSSSSYRRQRHHSLPSSYVLNQPFVNGAATGMMGLGPTAGATMNRHSSAIAQQPYYPQNQLNNGYQQQQHQYLNHPSSMYRHGQNYHHQPDSQQQLYHHYSKSGYHPQHYHSQLNSVAHQQQQQQQLLHYQQQQMQIQQQHQAYALHNNNPMYQRRGAGDQYYPPSIYHKNRMSM